MSTETWWLLFVLWAAIGIAAVVLATVFVRWFVRVWRDAGQEAREKWIS